MGGLGAGGGAGLLILIPVLAVTGAVELTVKGTKFAYKSISNTVGGGKRKKSSNLINTFRKRAIRKVGFDNFQRYYQELHDKATSSEGKLSATTLVEYGLATFFLGSDLYKAEEILLQVLAFPLPIEEEEVKPNQSSSTSTTTTATTITTGNNGEHKSKLECNNQQREIWTAKANANFILGIIHQYYRSFDSSWQYYDEAANLYLQLSSNNDNNEDDSGDMNDKIMNMNEEELIDFIAENKLKSEYGELLSLSDSLNSEILSIDALRNEAAELYLSIHHSNSMQIPKLRYDMALNGSAYSHFLYAMFPPIGATAANNNNNNNAAADGNGNGNGNGNGSESDMNELTYHHLSIAVSLYNQAIEYCGEKKYAVDGMYYYNLGKAEYYLSYQSNPTFILPSSSPNDNQQQQYDQQQEIWRCMIFEAAKHHLEQAINTEGFASIEEGYVLLAQCAAREGNQPLSQTLLLSALEINPRVFHASLSSEVELKTPWPLPQDNYTHSKRSHQFQPITLFRPHWCDHCYSFIRTMSAHHCSQCNLVIHSSCLDKLSHKHCWSNRSSSSSKKIIDFPISLPSGNNNSSSSSLKIPLRDERNVENRHIHSLVEITLKKPTWCDVCGSFIRNPLRNLACTECSFKCHRRCYAISGIASDSLLGVVKKSE